MECLSVATLNGAITNTSYREELNLLHFACKSSVGRSPRKACVLIHILVVLIWHSRESSEILTAGEGALKAPHNFNCSLGFFGVVPRGYDFVAAIEIIVNEMCFCTDLPMARHTAPLRRRHLQLHRRNPQGDNGKDGGCYRRA